MLLNIILKTEAIKEKSRLKSIKWKRYQQFSEYKKEALQNRQVFVFSQYKKMSEKTLKFDNIRVNKKNSINLSNQLT